jgi:hypothetical protein
MGSTESLEARMEYWVGTDSQTNPPCDPGPVSIEGTEPQLVALTVEEAPEVGVAVPGHRVWHRDAAREERLLGSPGAANLKGDTRTGFGAGGGVPVGLQHQERVADAVSARFLFPVSDRQPQHLAVEMLGSLFIHHRDGYALDALDGKNGLAVRVTHGVSFLVEKINLRARHGDT